jgi:hypothetical protein
VLVLIQVGVASLRRAKHTPHKISGGKNENSKPSDAESHAKPLSATLALTLSANLNFTRLLLFIFAGVFLLLFYFVDQCGFSFF